MYLEPHNPYALYGLGNCYRYEGDYHRAIELWERILKRETGTVNMLSRLGDAYRNIGDYASAEQAYRSALDNGYDKYALIGLAKLRCRQGRTEEAYDIFRKMLVRERDDPRFIPELGKLLLEYDSAGNFVAFYQQILSDTRIPEDTRERLKEMSEPRPPAGAGNFSWSSS